MGNIGPIRRRIEVVPETRPVLPAPSEPEVGAPERPEPARPEPEPVR